VTAIEMIETAVAHHNAGRVDDAERLYRQALEVDPDNADAWHLLGLLVAQRGNADGGRKLIERAIQLKSDADLYHINLASLNGACGLNEEAVAGYRRAIELNPRVPAVVHAGLGQALAGLGRNEEAVQALEWAVKREPNVEWIVTLAEALGRVGRQQESLQWIEQAIRLRPNFAEAHGALGLAMEREGRLDEAEACYRKAIELEPKLVQAHNNLGHVLNQRRQFDEAVDSLERAIKLRPDLAQAYNNLGDAMRGQGRRGAAIASYRQAVHLNAKLQAAWDSLGSLLMSSREHSAAADAFRQSTAIRPTPAALVDLGLAAAGVDQYDEAIDAVRKAIQLAPNSSMPYRVLGTMLRWCGRLDEAIGEFKRAMFLDPRDHIAHSGLLYAMLFHDDTGGRYAPQRIFEEHVAWGKRHTAGITPLPPPANDPSPDRRLRVGYISPNFRNQAVLFFVLPILENHDSWEVEVFCYSDVQSPDEWTQRVRDAADEWRDTAKLSDEELAKQIRDDRIDVLVELTGHIGDGRLRALTYKPAPVQVSYIGYQATSGVPAVDYLLTDDWADPPGKTEQFYGERPFRLPESFFVYLPPPEAPAVGPLPAEANGFVTFGCLNNLAKVTPRAISLWCEILKATPNSRLVLLAPGSAETDERIRAAFAAGGVVAERIEIVRRATPVEYLARYNRIDIALDPVPFNGHTTTCDAAWMGCPTVNRSGEIYAHRYGGSVMRNLNLAELVTESDEQYITAATALAGDVQRMARIRRELRETMSRSIITDGKRFTINLERAYRQMWRGWCAAR
jgi:predicted O-linked N-acetylglucosamine transferase (SPINDLY family)